MRDWETHLPFDDIEPERMWRHRGIWCAMYQNMVVTNGFNGYVMVPKGHPFRSFENYDEIPVDAHGGLTWGWENNEATTYEVSEGHVVRLPERKFSGEDRNWWIGFDTGHYMDFDHDDSAFREMRFTEMMVSRYTVEDVAKMTEYLADQVVNAQNDWNRLEMTVTESSDAELE
jgi:hypothetical protein